MTTKTKRRRITIRPSVPQSETIADDETAVVAFIAGTGAGKTVGGKIKQVKKMAKKPKGSWLVAEPTWAMVDRILMTSYENNPSLYAIIQHMDPRAIYEKGERRISANFGTIFLASASNPESMEGVHVDGAWLDEAGQMKRLAMETARRRVAAKNGQVVLTTTPYNRGWLHKDIYLPGKAGDPDIKIIQGSSLTNPTYSREAYERARRTMTEARFNMMHQGGFERPEGMIYGNQWRDDMIIEPFEIPESWWQRAAIDFGFNHPTAAVFGARSEQGVYYITDEYKKGETLLKTHAKNLEDIMRIGPKPLGWKGDPAARQERHEMRSYGIPVTPAKNEVIPGIDTVARLMGEGRLKVFNTCDNWIDEVEGYVWQEEHDAFIDKPVKLGDDLMDASRYLLHSEEWKNAPGLHI